MKLFEFLTHVLSAHAHTLQRLAAFFGEEEFLEILELAGDSPANELSSFHLDPDWFTSSKAVDQSSAYQNLEGTVNDFKLSAVLEFHLWTYPFYRSIIESSINLNSDIRLSKDHVDEGIIQQAVTEAKNWVKSLPLSPDLSRQAEQIAITPWVRFRSEVLKKMGKRPFASL